MKRPPCFASAVNAGQPTPAPQTASALPDMSIGGPSAAFSRRILFTPMPSESNTVWPRAVMPEACVPSTTGLPLRSPSER